MARKKRVAKRAGSVKRPVKKAKKRAVAKRPRTKTPEASTDKMVKVAKVTHYFPHVKAAAMIVLKGGIKIGDEIYIKGHTTDFKEKITSIQLDRVPIEEGKKSQEIGLLVKKRVRIGDSVYKL